MTVEGGGHTMIGRLVINSASAVVALRGLNLTGRGAHAVGINILSAKAVHIEDCTLERYTNDAIKFIATTATKLFISSTVARANDSNGLFAEAVNAQVVIENSGFDQNFSSGVYLKVAKASVTGSSASGNGAHGLILLTGRTKITETTADNNSGNGISVRAGQTVLKSAQTNGNGAAGLFIDAAITGALQLALMNDCVFLGNPGIRNEGHLYTTGNTVVPGYSGNPAQTLFMN